MAISAVSGSTSTPPAASPQRQAFGQLISAIQSGDLSAAQSAYATLTQGGSNSGNGPFAQALSQIGDALQSGDIGKAQAALASLQQQMQALKGSHHHHGHHHHAADDTQTASAATTTSSDSTASDPTNLVDMTA